MHSFCDSKDEVDSSLFLYSFEANFFEKFKIRRLKIEVESNRIERISNWFLSNFSNYFSPSNQSNHKFSNRIERISNESSIWKIWFHPIVGVESNRTNFELIFIKFFEYFLPFRINRIANFRIESNEFRTNSDLTPPLRW